MSTKAKSRASESEIREKYVVTSEVAVSVVLAKMEMKRATMHSKTITMTENITIVL